MDLEASDMCKRRELLLLLCWASQGTVGLFASWHRSLNHRVALMMDIFTALLHRWMPVTGMERAWSAFLAWIPERIHRTSRKPTCFCGS